MTDPLARLSLASGPLATPPLGARGIASHPDFIEAEAIVARRLIGIHEATPRISRLKSSHRKWMITQSLFALSGTRDPSDPLSGLTASRLIDIVIDIGAASRNTASAFLQELLAYKFLREVPDIPDKRVRVLEPTEVSIRAMKGWFDCHMQGLDRLDGGNRLQVVCERPTCFAWRSSMPHGIWSKTRTGMIHGTVSAISCGRRQAAWCCTI